MNPRLFLTSLLFLFVTTTGCHHQIAFDSDFSYSIDSPPKKESLTVVIDQNTRAKVVPIRSWATGIAHSWQVRPGLMLRQIADIEFPQLYNGYKTAEVYDPSLLKDGRTVLELSIPFYDFTGWHAIFEVQAKAHGSDGHVLFDEKYREEGSGQAGKMVGLGAFGMKSAVRQSSLEALKKIFTRIRSDLNKAMPGM